MTDAVLVVSPKASIFVIYDKVAEAWIGQPIVQRHPAPACRIFAELLGDPKTQLHAHPKDYELRHVAFIEETGKVDSVEVVTVMTGESWLAMQQRSNPGAE